MLRQVHVVIVVVLAGITAMAALIWLLTGSTGASIVALATACSIVLVAPPLTRQDYDPLEPAMIIGAFVLLGVTFQSWLILLSDDSRVTDVLLLGGPVTELIPAALVLAVGFIGFMLGYLRPPQLDMTRFRIFRLQDWDERRLRITLWIFLGVASIVFIDYTRRVGIDLTVFDLSSISQKRHMDVQGGQYRTALGYHHWALSLASVAFVVLWTKLCQQETIKSRLGAVTLAVGTIAAIVPVLTSSRTSLALLVVYAVLSWWYIRGRLPLKGIVAVIVLVATIIVGGASLRAVAQRGADLADTMSIEDAALATVGARNWVSISKVAPIVDRVPESVGYKYGGTMVGWATAPIPRTVWPEKPLVRVGPEVASEIYDVTSRSGVPPSFPGELYLNFGTPGVIGGMYLLGLVIGGAYTSFRPFLSSSTSMLIYGVIVQQLVVNLPRSDFNGAVVNLVIDAVPVMAVLLAVGGWEVLQGEADGQSPTRSRSRRRGRSRARHRMRG